MGTAGRVILLLVVAVVAGALLLGSHGSRKDSKPSLAREVPKVARRVEVLRNLRFKHIPKPRTVSAKQAEAEGLGEIDRSYPPTRRRADEEVLKLLGLIPPKADLRKISGAIYGEQVAGYYDPRHKRLSVVRGASGLSGEIVLAHELTHALEDQRFDIPEPSAGTDDGSTASQAIAEGTATALMLDYGRRYIGSGDALAQALGGLGDASKKPETKLPRYVQNSLEFPYFGGLSFVEALRQRAGGGWRLVNQALAKRPPASTEQVLHPEKWVARERPLPVSLRAAAGALPPGFKRIDRGELGEYDTREILSEALDAAAAGRAAAGWGGGRYALWQGAAPHTGCAAPCRRRDAFVISWRWDTARDAREFSRALTAWLALHLHARPRGGGSWRVGAGAAQVAERPRATALAFAPLPPQAGRLASASVR
jgi:hypothetical protein